MSDYIKIPVEPNFRSGYIISVDIAADGRDVSAYILAKRTYSLNKQMKLSILHSKIKIIRDKQSEKEFIKEINELSKKFDAEILKEQ